MNLLIRADANVSMGTGHAMRCLALAQAWQDEGGHAIFAMSDCTPSVEERLRREGIRVAAIKASPGSVEDSTQTAELALENHADWVVVDGYKFGSEYQRNIKAAGLKLLFIDDNGHANHYCADAILNQNLHATAELYSKREAYTRLLLGPRNAMLRREFKKWRGWKREIADRARKVLVTFGGSDPQNLTKAVIESLSSVGDLEVTVVVGGNNPHLPALRKTIAQSAKYVQVITNTTNMPELLASTDIAIAAAGITVWEMCLMGLPAIITDIAANQAPLALSLSSFGAVIHVDCRDLRRELPRTLKSMVSSAELRQRMSDKARQVVDGKGTSRVLALLRDDFRLRRAKKSDCRSFWKWANDPEVRAMSFSSEPIPWERHVNWFKSKLCDASAALYFATDDTGKSIGQVRYELNGGRAVLSLNIGSEFRGRGYGTRMLHLATEQLFQDSTISAIDAFVKPSNQRSLRLFEAAGFCKQGIERIQGEQAVHFVLAKRAW